MLRDNMPKLKLSHRIATLDDVPQIVALMQASIEVNMRAFLKPAEIEAAKECMGVDLTLLQDKTYFLIETVTDGRTVLVGCGGWGKRRTLYGGDHTKGRDDSLSDPSTEAARIRAMYTHPDWTRLGIGQQLLALGEAAARAAGFKTIELGSTLAGERFYLQSGYKEVSRTTQVAENGRNNTVIKMHKSLSL